MARRIALVEDDPAIRANYRDALARQGYVVAAFAGRAQAAGVDTTLVVGADMVHVYPAFLGLVPAAAEAFAEAGSFVQTHTPG